MFGCMHSTVSDMLVMNKDVFKSVEVDTVVMNVVLAVGVRKMELGEHPSQTRYGHNILYQLF